MGTLLKLLKNASNSSRFSYTIVSKKYSNKSAEWPRRTITLAEGLETEFGKDFGDYKVLSFDSFSPKNKLPLRKVPENIKKPFYYLTGIPKTREQRAEIKSNEQIERMRESCMLARAVLNQIIKETKIGVKTNELDEFAHNLIISKGAYPSPLNYNGFPKSICTSINNVACHGIPDERKLENGDMINIDVTVFINGYHGDCSETVLVGDVDADGIKLAQVTQKCLLEGINVCGPKVPFKNIGKTIEPIANENGYNIIPAFAGHGIGKYFHGPPDIYHVDMEYDGVMETGMTFTIEPILSQGSEVVEIQEDGWTAITIDNSRTAQYEHTVLITNDGVEILTL